MIDKQNETLMDAATEKIDNVMAANPTIPPEARQSLINEEYRIMLMIEPVTAEEKMDDNSGEEDHDF